MLHVVVDAANVVGSRPDGWWRDRPGAARRLAGRIVAVLVAGPDDLITALAGGAPAGLRVHLVLEGAAKAAVDLPTHPLLAVVRAERDGDAAIAALAGELAGGPDDRVLVVTADRALRERVRSAGGAVTGPGTLLDALPPDQEGAEESASAATSVTSTRLTNAARRWADDSSGLSQ